MWLLASALVVGFVSALVPFVPVEAFVVSLALVEPAEAAVAVAVAAAAGHTAGKLVVLASARQARGRHS